MITLEIPSPYKEKSYEDIEAGHAAVDKDGDVLLTTDEDYAVCIYSPSGNLRAGVLFKPDRRKYVTDLGPLKIKA